jgi:hypothetical protein
LNLEENKELFEFDGQSGVQKRRLNSFGEQNDDSLSDIFAHFLLVASIGQSLDQIFHEIQVLLDDEVEL